MRLSIKDLDIVYDCLMSKRVKTEDNLYDLEKEAKYRKLEKYEKEEKKRLEKELKQIDKTAEKIKSKLTKLNNKKEE